MSEMVGRWEKGMGINQPCALAEEQRQRGPSIKPERTKYSSGSLTRFSALPSGDFYFWRIFFSSVFVSTVNLRMTITIAEYVNVLVSFGKLDMK